MSLKLRDLIRAVRACKTAAEERAVISKECALIRTAIKEEDESSRHRNVAKLMYIHMLGYPTHFGQMECLKLISSNGFPEKRVGYLALTLLLNEQTEVLTLVTNSLKLDLSNSNQYIQALSLITIGNLATQDMARDLASDVEKLLKSSNSYLRKKAVLATVRLLKKEPDLIETLGDRIPALLKDRSHGVLVTGVQLMIDVLDIVPDQKIEYLKLVPSLVRLLRNFISMGFSPEHDVGGITDPFMQVKILTLLRRLGKGNDEASDQMNDVLAQVATNTETSKNAGNAILYECVQTIMEVQSDSSLRVLAVNILGRFLLNRDNNIRYVALNSLSKVVTEDISAVQRHRNTIVDCLKDADISIRQRALELIYQLVDAQNVVSLTAELLNYLVVANLEHKNNLVSKIIQIVEKYSPSKKWRVDTIITMLALAGNQTDETVTRTSIIFLTQADGLHAYATHKLYRALSEDTSQTGLLQVAIWCIGEHGTLITQSYTSPDDGQSFPAVSEHDIVSLLEKGLRLHNADISIKSFILNALVKLSVRFSTSSRTRIQDLIVPFKASLSLELQQRSLEYSAILNGKWDTLRGQVLASMPQVDQAVLRRRRAAFEDDNFDNTNNNNNIGSLNTSVRNGAGSTPGSAPFPGSSAVVAPVGGQVSLIDLDDIFGLGPSAPVPAVANNNFNMNASAVASPNVNKPAAGNIDLLSDLFSLSASMSPSTMPSAPTSNNMFNNMMAPQPPVNNMMTSSINYNSMTPMSSANLPSQSINSLLAFEKDGFKVIMYLSKPNISTPALSQVLCKYSNALAVPITDFVFQVVKN